MNREEKVLEIVRSSKVGNISCEEASIQICLLFSVVVRSEQLVCEHNLMPKQPSDATDYCVCTICGQYVKSN